MTRRRFFKAVGGAAAVAAVAPMMPVAKPAVEVVEINTWAGGSGGVGGVSGVVGDFYLCFPTGELFVMRKDGWKRVEDEMDENGYVTL